MNQHKQQHSVEALLVRTATQWRSAVEAITSLSDALFGSVDRDVVHSVLPDADHQRAKLEEGLKRLEAAAQKPEIIIATTGTTSSGKSTLANLLIGEQLLPKAVQEMSAGVVTVRHSPNERTLTIEHSAGATWDTGTWVDIDADEVRTRLETAMRAYRSLIGERAPSATKDIQPPHFTITWPMRISKDTRKLGIPPNADFTIVDLPGLKYIDDEVNGEVFREQARKALCIVAYNAFETDPKKQEALLDQIVDQVKILGGSPARMLFVLNRIDAFRSDHDPVASEQAFCDHVTTNIRTKVTEALPEYTEEAAVLRALPLSSEPGLYAVLANQCSGDEQAALLSTLEDQYKVLFDRKSMNRLPRDPSDWDDVQREWFIQETLKQSRVTSFEDSLCHHIEGNLPAILLPELVKGLYQPARTILQGLDALIVAYGASERSQLEKHRENLDRLYQELRRHKEEAMAPLEGLRAIAGSNDDRVGKLQNVGKKIEEDLALKSASLDALKSAIPNAVLIPIQRLNDFTYQLMEGEIAQDDAIHACPSASKLLKKIAELRKSPYGKSWNEKTKFVDGDVVPVRNALNEFTAAYSKVATELVQREATLQAERLRTAFKTIDGAVVQRLNRDSNPIVAKLDFQGLKGVFEGNFELALPQLQEVVLSASLEELRERVQRMTTVVETVEKRTWYTLFLGKKSVTETRNVIINVEVDALSVPNFGDLLETFMFAADVTDIVESFANWLGEAIDSFGTTLEVRLETGIKHYKSAFFEQIANLENHTAKRIEGTESRLPELRRAQQLVERSQRWMGHE